MNSHGSGERVVCKLTRMHMHGGMMRFGDTSKRVIGEDADISRKGAHIYFLRGMRQQTDIKQRDTCTVAS